MLAEISEVTQSQGCHFPESEIAYSPQHTTALLEMAQAVRSSWVAPQLWEALKFSSLVA